MVDQQKVPYEPPSEYVKLCIRISMTTHLESIKLFERFQQEEGEDYASILREERIRLQTLESLASLMGLDVEQLRGEAMEVVNREHDAKYAKHLAFRATLPGYDSTGARLSQ